MYESLEEFLEKHNTSISTFINYTDGVVGIPVGPDAIMKDITMSGEPISPYAIREFFDEALYWNETEEGHSFWEKLADEWSELNDDEENEYDNLPIYKKRLYDNTELRTSFEEQQEI